LCGGHAQCVSVCSTGAIQLFDKGRAKDDWRRTNDEWRRTKDDWSADGSIWECRRVY
jgi:ferredoxin